MTGNGQNENENEDGEDEDGADQARESGPSREEWRITRLERELTELRSANQILRAIARHLAGLPRSHERPHEDEAPREVRPRGSCCEGSEEP